MKTSKLLLTALSIVALIAHGPVTLADSSALSASFMASVNTGRAPLTVEFTDTSEGSPTGWQLGFGDGSYSKLQNPVYTYHKPGTYTVTLTVTDGAQSDSMSGDIIVTNPLVATPSPDTGRAPVIVKPIPVPVKEPRYDKPPHDDKSPVKKKPVQKQSVHKKPPQKSPGKHPADRPKHR